MGQYRQWLHFREVDQRLRSQLAVLTQTLTELQMQAELLSNDEAAYLENFIVQALFSAGPSTHLAKTPVPPTEQETLSTSPLQPFETVSPALFGWSHLPNLGLQEIQAEEPQHLPPLESALTPRPHVNLLPDTPSPLMDAHGETAPQLMLPWWLRNVVASPDGNGLIDQQSVRTNRLVQRWLERWRTTEPPPEPQEEQS